jgi:hypothetical protein
MLVMMLMIDVGASKIGAAAAVDSHSKFLLGMKFHGFKVSL